MRFEFEISMMWEFKIHSAIRNVKRYKKLKKNLDNKLQEFVKYLHNVILIVVFHDKKS